MEEIMTATTSTSTAASYQKDGFCVLPVQLPRELVERTIPRMDAVIRGEYETGIEPERFDEGAADPTKLVKIDHPHWSDLTIRELISHPDLGRAVAEISGANMVQVWTVQLLFKPPTIEGSANVGWHQDHYYWKTWWEGDVFTAWVALSDVTAEAGPVRFVPGSQTWGDLPGGDFFSGDLEALRANVQLPEGAEWKEQEVVLPPGGASLHHKLTLHGSGPNLSQLPRRSFAIHMRSEKSRPLSGEPKKNLGYLDDHDLCPVIFQR
jgi:hypothetical protein